MDFSPITLSPNENISPHSNPSLAPKRGKQGIGCRWHNTVTVSLRHQHREGTRVQQRPVPQNTGKQAWDKPVPCQSPNDLAGWWLTWVHISSVPWKAALLCLFCPWLKHLHPLVIPSCSSKHSDGLSVAAAQNAVVLLLLLPQPQHRAGPHQGQ